MPDASPLPHSHPMWLCSTTTSSHASSWDASPEYAIFSSSWDDQVDELMRDSPRRCSASFCQEKKPSPTSEAQHHFYRNAGDQFALPVEDTSDHDDSSSDGDWDREEDDILNFDSLPERLQPLRVGDPLMPLLSPFTEVLREAWEAKKSQYLSHDNLFQFPEAEVDIFKDSTSESEYTSSTVSSSPSIVDVRPAQANAPRGGSTWACPFYRFSPSEHQGCLWSLSLPSVRSTIQHVIADHQLAHFCPLCRTTFSSATERDAHIVARCCEKREDIPPPAGVSEDQLERIDAAYQRWMAMGASEEEQWFGLWEILFPGAPQPSSPYLMATHEWEATALRQFWHDEGHELVSRQLERLGVIRYGDSSTRASTHEGFHASVLQEILKTRR
jgi:hypothetical protein